MMNLLFTLLPMRFVTFFQSSLIILQSNQSVSDALDTPGFFENPGKAINHALAGLIFNPIGGLMKRFASLVFSTPVIQDGSGDLYFGFGPPPTINTPSTILDIVFNGMLPWMVREIYPYVWLPAGGAITIVGLLFFVSGVGFNGMKEMFMFKKVEGDNKSPLVGFMFMLFWFPLYVTFIQFIHGGIRVFVSDQFIGEYVTVLSQLFGVAAISSFSGTGLILLVVLVILVAPPYLIIALIMLMRAIAISSFLAFGPIIIGVSYTNIPVVSGACDKVLKKSVPIVLLPIPIAPILWMTDQFMWSLIVPVTVSPVSAVLNGFGLSETFVVGGLGWMLLVGIWIVFKVVSPGMAGGMGAIGKYAGAGALLGSGAGGGVVYASIKSGPVAGLARGIGEERGGEGLGKLGALTPDSWDDDNVRRVDNPDEDAWDSSNGPGGSGGSGNSGPGGSGGSGNSGPGGSGLQGAQTAVSASSASTSTQPTSSGQTRIVNQQSSRSSGSGSSGSGTQATLNQYETMAAGGNVNEFALDDWESAEQLRDNLRSMPVDDVIDEDRTGGRFVALNETAPQSAREQAAEFTQQNGGDINPGFDRNKGRTSIEIPNNDAANELRDKLNDEYGEDVLAPVTKSGRNNRATNEVVLAAGAPDSAVEIAQAQREEVSNIQGVETDADLTDTEREQVKQMEDGNIIEARWAKAKIQNEGYNDWTQIYDGKLADTDAYAERAREEMLSEGGGGTTGQKTGGTPSSEVVGSDEFRNAVSDNAVKHAVRGEPEAIDHATKDDETNIEDLEEEAIKRIIAGEEGSDEMVGFLKRDGLDEDRYGEAKTDQEIREEMRLRIRDRGYSEGDIDQRIEEINSQLEEYDITESSTVDPSKPDLELEETIQDSGEDDWGDIDGN